MSSFLPAEIFKMLGFVNSALAFESIQGYLSPLEGSALQYLAAHGPGDGCVVEVGSFMGRSTAFLASGAKSTHRGPVVAVDHFVGSVEHQEGGSAEVPEIVQTGSTYQAFEANMNRFDLLSSIQVYRGSSLEVVQDWILPIRLLFIDGDHSYEGSKTDFEAWEKFVVLGGIICFHDIDVPGFLDGVTRFYHETIDNNSEYRELCRISSMAIVEKLI